jgi:eukaryotic-like serine/threonine-protein kinase
MLDDRYELLEVIGDGGVGMVYRARRVNLERMVAVKVLHESLVEEAGFVGRFQREAVAMSRLYHPHCVAVIDSGVYESRPYLVLEYLPGQTIRQLLESGRLDPLRAVQITLQLLETLDYFHGHHVIHRDLKSENVMLVESSGSKDFVKVLDFGMAKILTGPGADSQLSKIGIVPGTPSAMAPEQIYQLPPDPRIDIYATGILLYEMIVGSRPFSGDMATVVKMQLSTPPKPPRQVLGQQSISEELEQVIMKSLEKDRVDRFGTASEMANALRATPEGRVVTGATETTSRSRSTAPLRRASVALLGVGAVFALGVVGVSIWSKPTRPHAELTSTSPSQVPAPPPPMAAAAPAPEPTAAPVPTAAPLPEAPPVQPDPAAALARAVAEGATAAERHAAFDRLRKLGEASRADLVAMRILDVEQATSCPAMRNAFKPLRASTDLRVQAFKADLRSRGRRDKHLKCLKRVLGR